MYVRDGVKMNLLLAYKYWEKCTIGTKPLLNEILNIFLKFLWKFVRDGVKMLQHISTEKMQCWNNWMEPLLNETWKIFKILVEVCPLSACTLHHMYITTGKQLLCLNPEKKPKTWLPWRNLTAYTDIIRPVKKHWYSASKHWKT